MFKRETMMAVSWQDITLDVSTEQTFWKELLGTGKGKEAKKMSRHPESGNHGKLLTSWAERSRRGRTSP